MLVIIGKSGQLAQALAKSLQLKPSFEFVCLGRNDLDITNYESLSQTLSGYEIEAIINASAYTAVDQAESDVKQANLLNAEAVKNLATVAKEHDAYLLHISTDYVFSGKQNTPYLPDTPYAPVNQYGASKMAGEIAITDIYPENSAIIRTSWVYSEFGNNFVKSMLNLMAQRDALNIVYDQVGSPTSADTLAEACLGFVRQNICGVHHVCDLGVTSWFDFAKSIYHYAREMGILHKPVNIMPILSEAYPTPAKRPHYSVLDTASARESLVDVVLPYWQDALQNTLSNLKQDSQ